MALLDVTTPTHCPRRLQRRTVLSGRTTSQEADRSARPADHTTGLHQQVSAGTAARVGRRPSWVVATHTDAVSTADSELLGADGDVAATNTTGVGNACIRVGPSTSSLPGALNVLRPHRVLGDRCAPVATVLASTAIPVAAKVHVRVRRESTGPHQRQVRCGVSSTGRSRRAATTYSSEPPAPGTAARGNAVLASVYAAVPMKSTTDAATSVE